MLLMLELACVSFFNTPKLNNYCLILLATYCCAFSVYADNTQLDTVQVSAPITETYFTPYDFIGSHQSINADQFNQSFKTLPDLLEQQSGIEIQSIGGIGQYSSPVIRGSSGQQVLVFWDGLLINGLNGGSADIGSLNLNLASKVDIYRSIAPIELSSSAVGGVIHIQSKALNKQKNESSGQATIATGSHGTQQYSLMQEAITGNYQWLLAGEYLTADNDFSYLEKNPVSHPNNPSYEPRYNNGTHQHHVLLKGLKSYDDGRVDFALQSGKSNRELSSKINFPANQAELSTQNKSAQIRLQHNWSKHYNSELLSKLNQQSQLYDDQYSSIGLGKQLNKYTIDGYFFQLNQYFIYNNLSALITARSQNEKTNTHYKLLNEDELKAQCLAGQGCETAYQRQQNDLAGRIQYQTQRNKISVQISRIFLQDKNLTALKSHDQYNHTTWSVGMSHQLYSNTRLYFNLADQVRLPSSDELFGDRGMSIGNPNLHPEKAKHHEVGLHFQSAYIDIKSSLYLRDVQQAIVGESDSRGVIRYSNLGASQHIGTEQNINWSPVNNWTFTANVTVQSNEIIKDERFAYYEGKQVAGYSQLYAFISTQWKKHNWDITLSNTFEKKGFYENANLLKKDTKNQWNASIGGSINNLRLSLDITDLTNNAARDYLFYPEPGRMYFLRAHTQW